MLKKIQFLAGKNSLNTKLFFFFIWSHSSGFLHWTSEIKKKSEKWEGFLSGFYFDPGKTCSKVMILFTFYWSYIFPSFFEEPRSRRTHIFDSSSMRQSYACCLMRNCLFPTENVLKKTLIVHNNVTTFLATACMHGLVVMCTLCTYSTIFQVCRCSSVQCPSTIVQFPTHWRFGPL